MVHTAMTICFYQEGDELLINVRGLSPPVLRGGRFAIEVKTSANFQGEKSYAQCAKYLDSLGLAEGWMPVFEKSKEKTWDEKIYSRDEIVDGKTIHVIGL